MTASIIRFNRYRSPEAILETGYRFIAIAAERVSATLIEIRSLRGGPKSLPADRPGRDDAAVGRR